MVYVYPLLDHSDYKVVGEYFGIWHEYVRAAHNGVHRFYYEGGLSVGLDTKKANAGAASVAPVLVLLLDCTTPITGPYFFGPMRKKKQRCFTARDFRTLPRPMTRELRALMDEASKLHMLPTAAANPGLSCTEVCKAQKDGRKCSARFISMLNNCKELRAAFGCEKCEESAGTEQPALVVASAPPQAMPNACLFTKAPQQSNCAAKHKLTRRLCPCVLGP
jgi:hypothetical protein